MCLISANVNLLTVENIRVSHSREKQKILTLAETTMIQNNNHHHIYPPYPPLLKEKGLNRHIHIFTCHGIMKLVASFIWYSDNVNDDPPGNKDKTMMMIGEVHFSLYCLLFLVYYRLFLVYYRLLWVYFAMHPGHLRCWWSVAHRAL